MERTKSTLNATYKIVAGKAVGTLTIADRSEESRREGEPRTVLAWLYGRIDEYMRTNKPTVNDDEEGLRHG